MAAADGMPVLTFHFQTLDNPHSPPYNPYTFVFSTDDTFGHSLILHRFAENNKSWMHCMQVSIMMHL